MGAAPGGWTRLLAGAGWQVTAVDPADLDPRVANLPGVRHIRKRIEETDLSGLGNPKGFHLLLNDMRMDARDSARLMVDTAPALLPGGHAIITLKLPEAHMGDTADHALKILRGAYEVQARQLFHNRSEITAALRSQQG
jgi:23S rRNA (cytidine2498-2'-O)-methyltransferase